MKRADEIIFCGKRVSDMERSELIDVVEQLNELIAQMAKKIAEQDAAK